MTMFPEAAESYIGRTPDGTLMVLGNNGYHDGRWFELRPDGHGIAIHLVGLHYDECIGTYSAYAIAKMAYDVAARQNSLSEALSSLEKTADDCEVKTGHWYVYVLHFDRKVGSGWTPIERWCKGLQPRQGKYKPHAGHYVGVTNNLEQRIKQHVNGNGRGSPLVKALIDQGGTFTIAQLYDFGHDEKGARLKEESIKVQKNTPNLCAICREVT